jgi:hypothetical protein
VDGNEWVVGSIADLPVRLIFKGNENGQVFDLENILFFSGLENVKIRKLSATLLQVISE